MNAEKAIRATRLQGLRSEMESLRASTSNMYSKGIRLQEKGRHAKATRYLKRAGTLNDRFLRSEHQYHYESGMALLNGEKR